VNSLTFVGMEKWMDLKNEIKIGDTVICISEPDMPDFVGSKWIVMDISSGKQLYYCTNKLLYWESEGFPFKPSEIILSSSLMEELL
jgi:hypothetical protein